MLRLQDAEDLAMQLRELLAIDQQLIRDDLMRRPSQAKRLPGKECATLRSAWWMRCTMMRSTSID